MNKIVYLNQEKIKTILKTIIDDKAIGQSKLIEIFKNNNLTEKELKTITKELKKMIKNT